MTPGAAWLVAGQHGDTIAQWRPRTCSAAKLAVSGDLTAADCSGPRQLADVIWCRAGSRQPAGWLAAVLSRYPGCAVAAIRVEEGGGCLVASRAGSPLFFHNELWSHALVCAMFVHAWLAAGWPLTALDPTLFEAVAGPAGLGPAGPIPFAMYYEDGDPSRSVSRRRISSASGASMLE